MRVLGRWGNVLLGSAWSGVGGVCISIDTVVDFVYKQLSIEALYIPLHPNGTGSRRKWGS